ncbi:MAG: ABC transporter permease [Phycisphaerales bacterium]|nr:ABC transporter permease [Phycisphaerales bacterium]
MMAPKYSQIRACATVAKNALMSILKNRGSFIFSVFFPLIFVYVFMLNDVKGDTKFYNSFIVAFSNTADTTNALYKIITTNDLIRQSIHVVPLPPSYALKSNGYIKDIADKKIEAIISIDKMPTGAQCDYRVSVTAVGSVPSVKIELLSYRIDNLIDNLLDQTTLAKVHLSYDRNKVIDRIHTENISVIDFILPGQIGFSVLSGSIFGVAFLFFNLKKNQILKRILATPIKIGYYIMGETIGRSFFQILTVLLLLIIGKFLLHLHLLQGFVSIFYGLIITLFGCICFAGYGFLLGFYIAKAENDIPLYANLFVMPQFVLCGTFFPISVLPHWLGNIVQFLPLSFFNDLLRIVIMVHSDNMSNYLITTNMMQSIVGLLIWTVIPYIIIYRKMDSLYE